MKKILFCLTALLLLAACNKGDKQDNNEATIQNETPDAVAAEDGNWGQQSTIQSDKPMVIDFFATWCGPCKMQAPILDEVEKNHHGEVIFQRIDIDQERELAEEFRIEGVPTLMFTTPKGEFKMLVGLQDAETIEQEIAELLKRSQK